MNTLKIPEAGVLLNGPDAKDSNLPTQAIPITLSQRNLDELINGVLNGDKLEVIFGTRPVSNSFLTNHDTYFESSARCLIAITLVEASQANLIITKFARLRD